MKQLLLFYLIILLPIYQAIGQAEANLWYFGKYAAVDFSSGEPKAIRNSQMSTEEGCASISDKDGNLLFYTDGISVWNRLHQKMPNGTGLMGHPSSTQSGVIVPRPNSKGIYYLFTIASAGREAGLRYSLVDMRLDKGLGDIAVKNSLLATPVAEKITAVKHRDGISIWVIAHKWNSNKFLAYKINQNGIATKPVESAIGAIHEGTSTNTQGYMKASPDGTQIALALEDAHVTELFDFDNATGKLSNVLSLQLPKGSYNYGIEFSPAGSLLYVSAAGTGKVYQYNLQAGSTENIQSSLIEVGGTVGKTWIGALQLAIDGKIYFPLYKQALLGVIAKPDSIGLACGYSNEGIDISPGLAQLGLPTFTQSFFEANVLFDSLLYFDSSQKVDINKEVILSNLLFDTSKAAIKPVSFRELNQVIQLLKDDMDKSIKIAGHTDNIGNKSFNMNLSNTRAESVKAYFIQQGIAPSRIQTVGFGSSKPVRNNTTAEGRQENRRVTFTLSE